MSALRKIAVAVAFLLVSSSAVGAVVDGSSNDHPENTTPTIPSDGPDHGVNNSIFQQLWSYDVDNRNLSADPPDNGSSSPRTEFAHRFARSTDRPFSDPPAVTDDWNDGDFGDYSPGDLDASVHPQEAVLEDGMYIKDAYISIFAVQPSTVLHRDDETMQYVSPDGHVRAVSDYRVVVPPENRTGSYRERWSIAQTRISSVELTADGRTINTGSGHKTTLSYTNLSGSPHLTVEADISVRLRNVTRHCPDWNSSATTCDGNWTRNVEITAASKTVSTSQTVVVSRISNSSGKRVQFENEETRVGAVDHLNTEWSTITVDDDVRVQSNWQFYTVGKRGWRTMITSSAAGKVRTESSVRPLQTHAFPSRQEPYAPIELTDNGDRQLTIEETWGTEHQGPALPPNVSLVPVDRYTAADSIALSSTHLDNDRFRTLTIHGIIQGQSRTVSLSNQQTVRETNLTLTVTQSNATHVVVHTSVTERTTGVPVTTGHVAIENQTTALNSSGEGTLVLSDPPQIVRGQYTSAPWWRTDQPYAASDDVTKIPANFPDIQTLIRLVVVTILWFIPVVALAIGFDYMSGGELLGLRENP